LSNFSIDKDDSLEAIMKIAVIFAAVALCIPGFAQAATPSVNTGSTTHPRRAQASKPAASSRFQTPYQRIMLPAIEKKLAARAANHTSHPAAAAPAASPAPAPNFGSFVAAPYFPAQPQSACIVSDNCGLFSSTAADFDQDGKQDLAVVQYDGTLNILLNDGKDGFQAPATYANPDFLTTSVQQVLVADVNSDGYPDVLVLDDTNNGLIVYLNQKNGTFSIGQQLIFTSDYGAVSSIAIGDLNGGGKLDIVTIAFNTTTATSTTITVQTYLGKGDGTFVPPTAALTDKLTLPIQANTPGEQYGISLGDLNGDGRLDLAAVFEENLTQFVVDVALGNKDGSFGTLNVSNPIDVPVFGIGPFAKTAGVQIVDVNGDGHPDLAADAGGTLYVALGDGAGNFQPPVQTANFYPKDIHYADVDGDGKLDMIVDAGDLEIWIGVGAGTFAPPGNNSYYLLDGSGEQSSTVADFNGDGNLDIALAGSEISLFNGIGKGAFHGAPLLSSTLDSVPAPYDNLLQAVGDYKGNGLTDILFIDTTPANPYVGAGMSDGKGNFTYTTAISAADTNNLAFIEPVQADFNGDGKQDILYAGLSGGLSVVLSNGDGTFKSPLPLTFPATDCPLTIAAVAALKAGGNMDIVVAYPGDASCGGSDSTPSGYFVALGNGDGTFAAPVFNPFGTGLYSVSAGDFNLDGIQDLILDDYPVGSGNYQVSFIPGNGDGTFGLGGSVLSDYKIDQVVIGDYNQDGKPDLVLLSEGEQSDQDSFDSAGIMLLPGDGDGTFGEVTQLGVGNIFGGAVLSDVNGDGIPDLALLVSNSLGGSATSETYYGFSILLGEGGGVFAPPVSELAPGDSTFLGMGNFYQDNAPDFVVANFEGTALYLAQGGTTVSLSSSSGSLPFGQTETLTAAITPSMAGRPAPTGTVSFYDGAALLGNAPVSSGSANFATSELAVGTHNISAAYSGDANFNLNSAADTPVTVTTLTPAFTLAAGASTLTVAQGAQGTVTLNLAANATFTGPVTLACSGAETNATCTVNPATITLTPGGTATATLVVGTTSAATNATNHGSGSPLSGSAGVVALGAMLWIFRGRRNWIRLISMASCLGLLVAALALNGCGNSKTPAPGNTIPTASKGNFTLTVTATPGGSGSTPQSATVAVTVQ
jgi:hypothetical protein